VEVDHDGELGVALGSAEGGEDVEEETVLGELQRASVRRELTGLRTAGRVVKGLESIGPRFPQTHLSKALIANRRFGKGDAQEIISMLV
jgi:hypothetical protein